MASNSITGWFYPRFTLNVDIGDESVKVFYFCVILGPLLLTGKVSKLFFCKSPMKASFLHILQFSEKENLQRVHYDPQLQHKAQESQQGLCWKSAEVIFVATVVTAGRSISCRNFLQTTTKILFAELNLCSMRNSMHSVCRHLGKVSFGFCPNEGGGLCPNFCHLFISAFLVNKRSLYPPKCQ